MSVLMQNLFSRIFPIEHICNIIPPQQLPFDNKTFKKLLKLACTDVPFLFQDKIFEQHEGMAMGSNLAPTFANFAMDIIGLKIDTSK